MAGLGIRVGTSGWNYWHWAGKLVAGKQPAFLYFHNDFHSYAVENAVELKQEVAQLAAGIERPAAGARRAAVGKS